MLNSVFRCLQKGSLLPLTSALFVSLAVHYHTTVAVYGLPTDARTVRTRQEHHTCRDLARLRWPTHRARELLLRFLVHCGRNQGRPYGARSDRVNANALTEVLVRETTREGNDCSLGGCVIKKIRPTYVGVDGGIVDDSAATFHVWEDVLGQIKHGVDIYVEGMYPLLPNKWDH